MTDGNNLDDSVKERASLFNLTFLCRFSILYFLCFLRRFFDPVPFAIADRTLSNLTCSRMLLALQYE